MQPGQRWLRPKRRIPKPDELSRFRRPGRPSVEGRRKAAAHEAVPVGSINWRDDLIRAGDDVVVEIDRDLDLGHETRRQDGAEEGKREGKATSNAEFFHNSTPTLSSDCAYHQHRPLARVLKNRKDG